MKKQFLGNVKSAHPLAISLFIISITMIPTALAMQPSSIISLPPSNLIDVNTNITKLKNAIIHSSPHLLQQLITLTNTGTILHDIAKKHGSFASSAQDDLHEIVNFLLSNGIDINAQDINGQTALHLAVNNKQLVFATALLNQADPTLSNPVDPTLQDSAGNNILHIIAQNPEQFIGKHFIINFIDTLMMQPSEKLKVLFLSTNNNNQTPAFLIDNITNNVDLFWIKTLKDSVIKNNFLNLTAIQSITQHRPYTKPSEVIEILSSEEEQAGTWQQHDIQAGEKRRQETETAPPGTTFQPPAKRQRTQPSQDPIHMVGLGSIYPSAASLQPEFTDEELEKLFLSEVPEERERPAEGISFRPIPPSNLINANIDYIKKLKNKIIRAKSQFLAKLTTRTDYGTVLHDIAKRKIIFSKTDVLTGIIDHLKLHGIDLNAQDANGQTALHVAINNQQFLFAEVLVDKGADPALQDNNGNNILHLLAHNQQNIKKSYHLKNFLTTLLNKSPEIVQSLFTTINHNNETPNFLFNSIKAQNKPWLNTIKNYIKEHSISIQPPPHSSQEVLPQHPNIVGLGAQDLPQQGLTIGQVEEHLLRGLETVEEPPTEGTSSGYPQYIPQQFPQDENGQTALHRACINKQFNFAFILLQSGANPTIIDNFGKTALDYLQEHIDSGQLTNEEKESMKRLLGELGKHL